MITAAPLARNRITQRLKFAGVYPATIVCAPEGFGKTTAIRQFLNAYPAPTLQLSMLSDQGTLTAFARALADTLGGVAPDLRATFAHAIEFALQAPHPEEELAIWFLGHLDRASARTVVIEDLHHAADERIFTLIERLIRGAPAGYRWLVSSRALPPTAQRWQDAALCIAPLTQEDLRLTDREMHEIAQARQLPAHITESLCEMTAGWPLAFSMGVSLPHWIERLRVLRPASPEGLYAFLAEQFFLQCDPEVQTLLLNASVFPTIEKDVVEASPWRDAWPQARAMAEDGRLLSLRHESSIQVRDLFREFLESRLEQDSQTTLKDACTVGAGLFEQTGHVTDALHLYARAGNDFGVLRLCELHGFALVDQGHLDQLQHAIAVVDPETASRHAVALAIRAIAESNASRSDVAESWYLHALEKAQTPLLKAQIADRYALDLIRHRRLDSIALLEKYMGAALPVDLNASLRSTLASAYVLVERFDDARGTIASALSLLDDATSKETEAKIYHHAAWVALFTGEVTRAKNCAVHAVELALQCGMYEIAARAYSVLYNIVYDVEDDPASTLNILDHILDCGLKAGSRSMRLYALLGSIDVLAEIGETKQLTAVEKMLDAYGVAYGDQAANETLIPAEALTLAGDGKFTEAYGLIFPTGERQVTPDRRALRFSEIALYAAAAGLAAEAHSALRSVAALLNDCVPSARRTIRTQLNRAIATRLLGRKREADRILEDTAQFTGVMSTRLSAFYDAVEAIFRNWDDDENYEAVYETLRRLHAVNFGGLAAALSSLPSAQRSVRLAQT